MCSTYFAQYVCAYILYNVYFLFLNIQVLFKFFLLLYQNKYEKGAIGLVHTTSPNPIFVLPRLYMD